MMRSLVLAAAISVAAGTAPAAIQSPVIDKTATTLTFLNGCAYVPAATETAGQWTLVGQFGDKTDACPQLIQSKPKRSMLVPPTLVGVYR